MQRRKMGFVPGKSGTPEKIAEQETFREEVLEPLLAAAKAGTQAVFLSMPPTLFTPFFWDICGVLRDYSLNLLQDASALMFWGQLMR